MRLLEYQAYRVKTPLPNPPRKGEGARQVLIRCTANNLAGLA